MTENEAVNFEEVFNKTTQKKDLSPIPQTKDDSKLDLTDQMKAEI